MSLARRNFLALVVTALGCSQMLGYFTGAKTVSACGAGLCFAPMAEVFCAIPVRSPAPSVPSQEPVNSTALPMKAEPFALSFHLSGVAADGQPFTREVGPEAWARLEGPHARRAFYLAALSADLRGQVPAQVERAWCVGFAADGPLRAAFDVPEGARDLVWRSIPRDTGADFSWVYPITCTQ